MKLKCSKCASDKISTAYHNGRCSMYIVHNRRDDEHLHYYCQRCSYDWTGDTLDKNSDNSFKDFLTSKKGERNE